MDPAENDTPPLLGPDAGPGVAALLLLICSGSRRGNVSAVLRCPAVRELLGEDRSRALAQRVGQPTGSSAGIDESMFTATQLVQLAGHAVGHQARALRLAAAYLVHAYQAGDRFPHRSLTNCAEMALRDGDRPAVEHLYDLDAAYAQTMRDRVPDAAWRALDWAANMLPGPVSTVILASAGEPTPAGRREEVLRLAAGLPAGIRGDALLWLGLAVPHDDGGEIALARPTQSWLSRRWAAGLTLIPASV